MKIEDFKKAKKLVTKLEVREREQSSLYGTPERISFRTSTGEVSIYPSQFNTLVENFQDYALKAIEARIKEIKQQIEDL